MQMQSINAKYIFIMFCKVTREEVDYVMHYGKTLAEKSRGGDLRRVSTKCRQKQAEIGNRIITVSYTEESGRVIILDVLYKSTDTQ